MPETFHALATATPAVRATLRDLVGDDDAAIAGALGLFTRRQVAAKAPLFEQDDAGDSLFVIESGRFKLLRTTPSGRPTLLALLGPGEMVGDLSLLDGRPRAATAVAVTPAVVLELPQDRFDQWLAEQSTASSLLLRNLARRLRRSNDVLADLVFADVPTRVARIVLELADRFGEPDAHGHLLVPHQLTQEELAQLVGAARESVNKALSTFARRGWIELHSKRLTVLDPDRLARFVG